MSRPLRADSPGHGPENQERSSEESPVPLEPSQRTPPQDGAETSRTEFEGGLDAVASPRRQQGNVYGHIVVQNTSRVIAGDVHYAPHGRSSLRANELDGTATATEASHSIMENIPRANTPVTPDLEVNNKFSAMRSKLKEYIEDGKSSLTAEPFETHKNTVRRFFHPGSPRMLQELIAKGAIDDVTEVLAKDFNVVACGEFHWLHDLVDSGCGMREIAELLVDVEASTPWLYFDSIIGYQHAMLSPDSHYHYHSCVHDVASRLHQGSYDIETGKLEEVFGQSEGSASKRTTQNQKVLGPYKFTHLELERQGVIQKSNVPENRRANIYFNITSPSPGTFVISLHYKGRNRGLLELDLKLDDLLEMQKEGQEDLDLEYVQFNVTKVLALLNKRFARKRGW